MINDWHRLNLEVALTAQRFSGIEHPAYHDGLAQQIAQNRIASKSTKGLINILKFWKRISKY